MDIPMDGAAANYLPKSRLWALKDLKPFRLSGGATSLHSCHQGRAPRGTAEAAKVHLTSRR